MQGMFLDIVYGASENQTKFAESGNWSNESAGRWLLYKNPVSLTYLA